MDQHLLQLTAGSIFIIALAFLAVKARAIDVPGAFAGAIITFATFLGGGVRWLIIIVAFFVTSVLLTRYHYGYKKKLGSAQEKGGTRSWPNTIANGGVSAVLALLNLQFHQTFLVIAFMTSVGAAMSDTIATELGLLSRSKPRLITNPTKAVEPGTSGGVTILGEAASLGSALGIAILGTLLSIIGRNTNIEFAPATVAIVIGSLSGTTVDSLLGATVQGAGRCRVCGALTENRVHHGEKTELVKGTRYIDNNVVNMLGILSGVIISVLVYSFA